MTVKASEKAKSLTVTVRDSEPPGVVWIRLINEKGASSPMPLLIANSVVTLETDQANNHFEDAQTVTLPSTVTGRLDKSGDVDCYRVSLRKGQTFVASMTANQILKSPMDAVIQLIDLKGNVIAQTDDDRRLDPQLIYPCNSDCELILRIFAFPSQPNSTVGFAGNSKFIYALQMTDGPFLDHVHPILTGQPIDKVDATGWNLSDAELHLLPATKISPPTWHATNAHGWAWQCSLDANAGTITKTLDNDQPTTIDKLPVVIAGRINRAGQTDHYQFAVEKGKRYVAKSYSRSEGLRVDTVLTVVRLSDGKQIAKKDDISRTDFDSQVDFKAAADGVVELHVSDAVDAFGPRHAYAVQLTESVPTVRLTVGTDHFEIKAGSSVEIPVTVAAQNGFQKKLQYALVGSYNGLSLDKVTDAKSVKLKLHADQDCSFQGAVNLHAKEFDEKSETGATHPVTFQLLDRIELSDIWITVHK